MQYRLGKLGISLVLCGATIALSGCLLNDKVDEASAVAAAPNPAPPPAVNQPPTISGSPPPAVKVGENYSFTPIASDPNGDPLTFSIQNQPMWADFDPMTGTVSGVASLGTEGTYADIQITVSDGVLSASLPQFSVEVTQIALGSVTLSWTAPTQNTDGSPLMDLSAYKIYYGTSPGSYGPPIVVDNPGLTTYVVEDLVPDTYYFVASAVNSTGIESNFSNMATKTIAAN